VDKEKLRELRDQMLSPSSGSSVKRVEPETAGQVPAAAKKKKPEKQETETAEQERKRETSTADQEPKPEKQSDGQFEAFDACMADGPPMFDC